MSDHFCFNFRKKAPCWRLNIIDPTVALLQEAVRFPSSHFLTAFLCFCYVKKGQYGAQYFNKSVMEFIQQIHTKFMVAPKIPFTHNNRSQNNPTCIATNQKYLSGSQEYTG